MPTEAERSSLPTSGGTASNHLACMEIWGGNRAIETALTTAGLHVCAFARPHQGHEAGGDIHYASSCLAGRITRVLIADVSGHGERVAGVSARLRSMMRRHINTPDQSRFARSLNEEFAHEGGGIFATAFLASYLNDSGTLVGCNAGHPRPMLWRDADARWMPLGEATPGVFHDSDEGIDPGASGRRLPVGLPLGVVEPTEYTQFALPLGARDGVLLYTDSLQEVRRDDGEMLGERGLEAVLNEVGPPDDRLIRRLLDRLRDRHGIESFDDDLTAMVLRPMGERGRGGGISLRERAGAVGRMLGVLPDRASFG